MLCPLLSSRQLKEDRPASAAGKCSAADRAPGSDREERLGLRQKLRFPLPYNSKISQLDVRITPERHLQQNGLGPGLVHLLNLVLGVSSGSEKWTKRRDDGEDERRKVTKRNVLHRIHSVRLILAGAVMAPANLELVVEPALVVFGSGRLENPLPETLAHLGKIPLKGLSVRAVREIVQQVRISTDEAVPDIQDLVSVVLPPEAATCGDSVRPLR